MAKYFFSPHFHRQWRFSGILFGVIIAFIFPVNILADTVTFDDDCSNVQCPAEVSLCPSDSLERKPAPVFDVLYGPDEYMPPHEFYDDVGDPVEEVEQHYDEIPLQLNVVTKPASTSATTTAIPIVNTTTSQLPNVEAMEEPHKQIESILRKREITFNNKDIEDTDEYERMLRICCNAMPEEQLRRRRRRRIRRHSTLDDCECKPCETIPQCPNGEVAIKMHDAAGTPGDCCPSWACAPKRACDDANAQPYWRDACTRCSCYGTKGPELCHNECPAMDEEEMQRTCFTSDTLQPMEHDSDWYENDYCTKCHCENGVRDCVESLCKPNECTNPIKVSGQCCPQCPEGVENILVAHENSTLTSRDSASSTEQAPQTTTTNTTSYKSLESSTAETTSIRNASPTELNDKMSTESSQTTKSSERQSTSTETTTELFYSSTASSTEFYISTELSSTTRVIDDIAAEGYFGPIDSTSTEDNTTTSEELIERVSESTSQSSQTVTSVPRKSSKMEFTESTSNSPQAYELDRNYTTTTSAESTNSPATSPEISTEESSASTESLIDLSTSSSSYTDNGTSTTSAGDSFEIAFSSSVAPQETPQITSTTTDTTMLTNSKPSEPTTPQMDSTTSSTPSPSTTLSTTSIIPEDTSSTHTYTSTTSSPYTSSVKPSTSTTSSPFSSTSPTQPTSTVIYWYTFSTSAPSPPIPQPTVYQPSVRQFFTRPAVRYIGAAVFIAFIGICALAVWKFCMPSRSTRLKLKNRYRTVPSSEATSLSHSPTTSHSSMA